MFEKKITKNESVKIKDLMIENGKIVDVDGSTVDLNRVVELAFEEGDVFTFNVTSKSDDSITVEDEVDADEE